MGVVSLAMASGGAVCHSDHRALACARRGIIKRDRSATAGRVEKCATKYPAKPRKPFDEMWLDAGLAIKSDRLGPAPKLVRTVMVVPDAVMPPDPPKRKPVVKPKRTKTVERDVCRGKGKVYINGGPAWPCKG